jgi:hypothetical protein
MSMSQRVRVENQVVDAPRSVLTAIAARGSLGAASRTDARRASTGHVPTRLARTEDHVDAS